MSAGVKVDFNSLVAPGLKRAHKDILASKDTDPKSPTYGQYLREYFFRGGRGCVDGDTLIDTPSGKVKVRDFRGGLIYAFDGKRVVESYACRAVKCPIEKLFEVRTSDGRTVICTDQHRFLTSRGWVELHNLTVNDSIYAFGSQTVSSNRQGLLRVHERDDRQHPAAPSSTSCILHSPNAHLLAETTSFDSLEKHCAESQEGSREDVRHSMRKLLSCLYRYWHDCRLCDGRLPTVRETYRDVLRQLNDAPSHTPNSSHEDGQGGEGSDIRYRREHLRSKPGCQLRKEDRCCEEAGSEISQMLSGLLLETFPSMVQCLAIEDLDGSIQRVAARILSSMRQVSDSPSGQALSAREVCNLQMLSGMLQRSVGDESFSDSLVCSEDVFTRGLHIKPITIVSVSYKKTDNYYDLFVPFYNNYISNGIISHNSTKSTLISLEIVRHVVENPKSNCVVFVRVAENIRDSVYKQILWAIDHLELNDFFKCTTSPFRCVYKPTGQEILFRGLDKAGKIKGIKPTVGFFDIVWFEELTEFSGMEDCRSVVQSVLRGGDEEDDDVGENVRTWEFYSYNPPPTIANWVNVEANRIVPGRKVYDSNYLTVPVRWLRKDFFTRADILKASNPRAYAHEYLGWVTGTGGNIFNNLEIRRITDEEISRDFDNRCFGLDWGFARDYFVWHAMHFDRRKHILYVFDEIKALGKRTQETAELVRKKMERIGGGKTVYADCAEPDSIADYNAWGIKCEGAPKPRGLKWSGRDYEWRALQDLRKIVVDPIYCSGAAEELQRLEYPKSPNGDFKSEYPHSDHIAAIRYGCFFALRDAGLLSIC